MDTLAFYIHEAIVGIVAISSACVISLAVFVMLGGL